MSQQTLALADDFRVAVRVVSFGGYNQWRLPPPGRTAKTMYGLLHCGRWAATLGELCSGISDADLANFCGHALRRIQRLGLSEAERRDVAQQLRAKGVPYPEQATWRGSTDQHWAEVVAELTRLMADQE